MSMKILSVALGMAIQIISKKKYITTRFCFTVIPQKHIEQKAWPVRPGY